MRYATQFQIRCMGTAILVLLLMHILLFSVVYRQSKEFTQLKRDHDYLRRSVGYEQGMDAVYFKPLIYGDKPLFEYGEAVDMLGKHWFPADWQVKPLR